MKKLKQNNDIVNTPSVREEENNIKTTNVNILLNRVRLDKKRVLKKRIIFSTILVFLVSSLAIFFIV